VIRIEANANIHQLAGENILDKPDTRFQEYRRKWKTWPENFHVGEFPLFIDIESTSVCNLRCPFCSSTYLNKKIKKGFITFELVKKIIDEGTDNGLYGVKFNFRGEPLLHPEIHSFVKYAKDKGLIDVYFNTNALELTEEVSKRLIDSGLDRISISFEGHTKALYESYRVGSDFDTVVKNVENLKALRERLRIDYPKIRVQMVCHPGLKDTIEDYKTFWEPRADEIAYLDYKEMKKRKSGIEYPWACPQIWQRMLVLWDGSLLPCNHDDRAELCLGNVRDVDIKTRWHSDYLNFVREKHKQGRAHELKACDGCYLRDSEIKKLMGQS